MQRQVNRTLKTIVSVGFMAALVFVGSMISVPIPTILDVSRLHLGNIFCLLGGFILGGLRGGLAAGIGSMLYDFTNPKYISSAPFTFVNKFMMAFVCGAIAGAMLRRHADSASRRRVGMTIASVAIALPIYIGIMILNSKYFAFNFVGFQMVAIAAAALCGVAAVIAMHMLTDVNKRGIAASMYIAAALGALTYVALYLGKSFVTSVVFMRVEVTTALIDVQVKAVTSLVNAVLATAFSVPLAVSLRAGLKRAGLAAWTVSTEKSR